MQLPASILLQFHPMAPWTHRGGPGDFKAMHVSHVKRPTEGPPVVHGKSFVLSDAVAKEQAKRRALAFSMFDLGQKAYGRGMYGCAIEFLEGTLTIIPIPTLFGGEVS
ncbi:Tetratricopeptide-like helical [Sesbania bispinosa]|nr:Tetratricopeptide-like helical [Sesbania bispinosa]